jgi:hypothetical protein
MLENVKKCCEDRDISQRDGFANEIRVGQQVVVQLMQQELNLSLSFSNVLQKGK